MSEEATPTRLYFQTYLRMVENSVGSQLFRNFYMLQPDGRMTDALRDGSDSCAFFVSGILTMFGKTQRIHGTVKSAVTGLLDDGWRRVDDMQPGDVVVWDIFEESEHIGFYLGNDQAISTSSKTKLVAKHDVLFDGQRQVSQIFRYNNWE